MSQDTVEEKYLSGLRKKKKKDMTKENRSIRDCKTPGSMSSGKKVPKAVTTRNHKGISVKDQC